DESQTDVGSDGPRRQVLPAVTGAVVAAIVATIDEGVLGLAVRRDGGEPQYALLVLESVRLARRSGAALDRVGVGGAGVVDEERQVVHPVTVLTHVAHDRRFRREAG